MDRKKILILGCGNIGSRHLQALTNLPYDLEIGIPEEIAIMLDNTSGLDLVTLEYAAKLNQITEKIMGYPSN